MTYFHKIRFSLVVAILSVTGGNQAKSVTTQDKVHIYCQAQFRHQANIIIKPVEKYKGDICIFVTEYCSIAIGKVFFDERSETEAYLSKDRRSCI